MSDTHLGRQSAGSCCQSLQHHTHSDLSKACWATCTPHQSLPVDSFLPPIHLLLSLKIKNVNFLLQHVTSQSTDSNTAVEQIRKHFPVVFLEMSLGKAEGLRCVFWVCPPPLALSSLNPREHLDSKWEGATYSCLSHPCSCLRTARTFL